MPNLHVDIKNKIATGDGQIVVCENSDYVVKFTFDAEWDEYQAKTMRVVFSNGEYYEVVFNGDECALPMIQNRGYFIIGVYAGELHTTAGAHFDCKKSILSDSTTHVDPPEDIYNQIMDAINSGMLKGETGDYYSISMELNPVTGVLSATYTRHENDE